MKKQNFTLRFLRLFPEFRKLSDSALAAEKQAWALERKAESDRALIESLNRYITALEGRDKERLILIEELKDLCAQLRKHLAGVLPSQ